MLDATKRFFFFLFFAALQSGCIDTPQVTHDPDPAALTMAFEAMPGRLDPRFATDAYAGRIGGLVFVSLMRVAPSGDFLPYLASSWRWEDEKTCLFELDRGFAFADGATVTADDVVATYASVLAPGSGSPRRAALESVEGVAADGPARVRFRLRGPDAAFLEGATLGILPAAQALAASVSDRDLVASGPYRISAIEHNRRVLLEANPSFTQRPVPIGRIEIRIIPDTLTRALELRSGNVDLVQSAIDPDTVDWLGRHEPTLTITRSPSANLQYLGMNLRHPALANLRVRRAIAHAIDRSAMVAHLLAGQGRVADSFLPPDHWAHAEQARRYGANPARARELLDAAGWPDPDGSGPQMRMTLSYKTTTDDLARRLAEALEEQLRGVGIGLEIRTYDWGTFFSDIRHGDFHLYSLQWVGIEDPDLLRQILHSTMVPPRGNNRGGYSDRRIDTLTDAARAVLNQGRRRALYARVERRAARTLPLIPLWWPERIIVSSDRLKGFRPHPAGDLFGLLDARLSPPASQRPR